MCAVGLGALSSPRLAGRVRPLPMPPPPPFASLAGAFILPSPARPKARVMAAGGGAAPLLPGPSPPLGWGGVNRPFGRRRAGYPPPARRGFCRLGWRAIDLVARHPSGSLSYRPRYMHCLLGARVSRCGSAFSRPPLGVVRFIPRQSQTTPFPSYGSPCRGNLAPPPKTNEKKPPARMRTAFFRLTFGLLLKISLPNMETAMLLQNAITTA